MDKKDNMSNLLRLNVILLSERYPTQVLTFKKRSFVGVIKSQKLTFRDLFACLYYN